jgi:hypothetical protein
MATPTIVPPGTPPVAGTRRPRKRGEFVVAGRSRTATGFFNAIGLLFSVVLFFPI